MPEDKSMPKSAVVLEAPDDIQNFLHNRTVANSRPDSFSCREGSPNGEYDLSIIQRGGLCAVERTLPTEDELAAMARKRNIAWEPESRNRVIQWWASDERVDRDGDIIRQDWNLANYANNPILLYGHEWESPPIGASLNEEVSDRETRGAKKYKGPGMLMTLLFADEQRNAFGDAIYRMAKAGFIRTGSVGFYPGRIIRVEDDEERDKLGLGPWGVIMENNELLEFSIVTIPSNVGAHQLSAAKGRGMLRETDLTFLREAMRLAFVRSPDTRIVPELLPDAWRRSDERLRSAWTLLYPKAPPSKDADFETPILIQDDAWLERMAAAQELAGDPAAETVPDVIELTTEEDGVIERIAAIDDRISSMEATLMDIRELLEARSDEPAPKEIADEIVEDGADTRSAALELLLSTKD